jgi:uncharacterized protein YukE
MPMPNDFLDGQTPVMDKAAVVAQGIVANLNTHEANLRPVVEAARPHWHGTPLPVFEGKHEEWRAALTNYRAKLEALADVSRRSGIRYMAANDDSAAAIGSAQPGAAFGGALGGPAAA